MSFKWLRWPRRAKPYREVDFRRREHYRDDYLELGGYLLEDLEFESVIDVGCANGFLLEAFDAAGKELAGIEASAEVVGVLPRSIADRVAVGDFSEATGSWDLVCCVEVAEHIPPDRSGDLVATLSGLARRWIYFTAAPPGQGGRGHINCRPHEEWLAWFAEAGWHQDRALTRTLREQLQSLTEAPWLRTNSFILGPTG